MVGFVTILIDTLTWNLYITRFSCIVMEFLILLPRIPLKMPGASAALVCGVRKAMEQLLMRCAVNPEIAAFPQVQTSILDES